LVTGPPNGGLTPGQTGRLTVGCEITDFDLYVLCVHGNDLWLFVYVMSFMHNRRLHTRTHRNCMFETSVSERIKIRNKFFALALSIYALLDEYCLLECNDMYVGNILLTCQ
jgi:hypothetical protein